MEGRLNAGALDGVEDDHAQYIGSQLRVSSLSQLFGISLQEEVGDVAS